MALALKNENGVAVLTLCGCTGCGTPSCGHFARYEWKTSERRRVNVACRLFLHNLFGRAHILDGLLASWQSGWKPNENGVLVWKEGKKQMENGMEVWKHVILQSLAEDPTWKLCPVCEKEYASKQRDFGNIVFIVPGETRCVDHAGKTPKKKQSTGI